MHYSENPFMPRPDSVPNQLIHKHPKEFLEKVLISGKVDMTLPPDCTFEEIPLDACRKEIIEFINRHHASGDWRTNMTDNDIDYYITAGNVKMYGIRWKGMLIAIQSMVPFDVKCFDNTYKSIYTNYLTVHPKFRKTGLNNLLLANIFIEAVRQGYEFEFYSIHADLDCARFMIHNVYNMSLSNAAYMSCVTRKPPSKPTEIKNRTIRDATIEDLRKLNHKDHLDIYLTYTDDQLKAIQKHHLAFTNGDCVLYFFPSMKIYNNIVIKSVLLLDWVNMDISFFREAIEELRSRGHDMLVVTSNGGLKDVITTFDMDKNGDIKFYSANMLPKAPKGRINLSAH